MYRMIAVILLMCPITAFATMQEVETRGGLVRYNERLIRAVQPVLQKKLAEYNRSNDNEADVDIDYPFDIKLTDSDNRYFRVLCDGGLSADPFCKLNDEACGNDLFTQTCKLQLDGLRNITIPGDGCVYSHGNANDNFDRHVQYCLKEDKFVETEQPFHAVGLKSEALAPITLYADKALTRPSGRIDKGRPVEIILTESHLNNVPLEYFSLYLVKNEYGILGWAKLKEGIQNNDNADVKGLYFNGD